VRGPGGVAMALSKLSGDEQGIILVQLRNTLEPRLVMYFSSASKELRALLTPAVRQQLRTDYEEATALCINLHIQSCKELREATKLDLILSGFFAANLATLATLGTVLPALEELRLGAPSSSFGPDGVQRLAEGLVAGALPAVTFFLVNDMDVYDAGASALAAALDRGALPRLKALGLCSAGIGDAGLVALAPALRRRPALEWLYLARNRFGDEGLAALVAPPPPAAGTPPRPAGGLKKLKMLDISMCSSDFSKSMSISDAGCASLVVALDSGALPALEMLNLAFSGDPNHVSDAGRDVLAALARSRARA